MSPHGYSANLVDLWIWKYLRTTFIQSNLPLSNLLNFTTYTLIHTLITFINCYPVLSTFTHFHQFVWLVKHTPHYQLLCTLINFYPLSLLGISPFINCYQFSVSCTFMRINPVMTELLQNINTNALSSTHPCHREVLSSWDKVVHGYLLNHLDMNTSLVNVLDYKQTL